MRALFAAIMLFVVSCSDGCAGTVHWERIPSASFYSVQCEPVRRIICLTDADLTPTQCRELLEPAIKAINDAIGRPVFELGAMHAYDLNLVKHLIYEGFAVVVAGSMPRGVLGSTHPETRDEAHPACITGFVTIFNVDLWHNPDLEVVRNAVAIHELIHGLGVAHAEHGSSFKSIMTPSVGEPSWSENISKWDANMLRGVYNP